MHRYQSTKCWFDRIFQHSLFEGSWGRLRAVSLETCVFYFWVVLKDSKASTPFIITVSKRSESSEYHAEKHEKISSPTSDKHSTFTRLNESRPFDKFSWLCSDMIQHTPHHRAASCCINIPSRLFNCRSGACLLETLTLTPRPDLIPDRLLLVLLNFFQATIWNLKVHWGTRFGACLLAYSMQ